MPKNSVGTKQLKKNAVTAPKIKNGAVTASKINTTGLTVPNATNATHATNADHATSAGSAPPSGSAGGALSGTYPNPILAAIEAWHEVGAAGEPSFQNGWTNFPGWSTMAFAKDSEGFVHLKGTILAGTFGAPVFTLPAGYRPARDLFMPVAAERNAYILTTGEVEIVQESSNMTAGFDGLSFKAG